MALLDIKILWESNNINLKTIKKTIDPKAIYLTAPLLIVGVQKMEQTELITNDVNCSLQDPTGN